MLNMNTGPSITTGNLDPTVNREPDQGPSLTFQGSGILDPRFVQNIGSAPGAKVYGLYSNSFVSLVDGVPQPAAAARVAAAATVTSGTPMTLVSAQGVGVSPKMPIVPFGQAIIPANVVQTGLTLDFGFATCNTVNGTPSIVIPAGAWRYFYNGQKLIISGAGLSGGPLFCSVVGAVAANQTTITISTNALATLSNTQVGTSDLSGVAAWPFALAGACAMLDPTQSIARGLSVTSNNVGDTGWTVTVRGYDLMGQAMSETINVSANATAYGWKAWKHIVSVTPTKSGSSTGTFSIGTSDLFGFNVRTDYWEYMEVFFAGAFQSVNTGWVAADATQPATSTTHDVRGCMEIGTLGPVGAGAAGGPTDGVKRLAAFCSIPLYNAINANNLNYATLAGVTQA